MILTIVALPKQAYGDAAGARQFSRIGRDSPITGREAR
jgi:hypothetical protein